MSELRSGPDPVCCRRQRPYKISRPRGSRHPRHGKYARRNRSEVNNACATTVLFSALTRARGGPTHFCADRRRPFISASGTRESVSRNV